MEREIMSMSEYGFDIPDNKEKSYLEGSRIIMWIISILVIFIGQVPMEQSIKARMW